MQLVCQRVRKKRDKREHKREHKEKRQEGAHLRGSTFTVCAFMCFDMCDCVFVRCARGVVIVCERERERTRARERKKGGDREKGRER